jgi:NitT/TauT family transport system substrate-binding protein
MAAAEPPPEIKRIRLSHLPVICLTPQYLAEELLHSEGFEMVEYVESTTSGPDDGFGQVDFDMIDAPSTLYALDRGLPSVALAGLHVGCYELFVTDRVQGIRDLKGKRIAIDQFGGVAHVFVASIVAYVGMDPRTDVDWKVAGNFADAMRFFVEGKADAFLAGPPQPQELRLRKIGHVIVNTIQDRPWSQYFCCLLHARREFVQKYPVATKRALRAMLKAADICAQEPERAARYLAAKDFEPRYELALEVLKQLSYGRWREDNPEDTLRFHALRLHEVGMIKTPPHKLIAQSTDWRFLNELKKELKG